jgi:hypothetical protein
MGCCISLLYGTTTGASINTSRVQGSNTLSKSAPLSPVKVNTVRDLACLF